MKYTAITIGPIYKTLKNARKTREFWGGSYLFSYMMKQIIKEIKKTKAEIILPFSDNIKIKEKRFDVLNDKYEAGLFPDRLIVKENDNCNFSKIQDIIKDVENEVKNEVVREINIHFELKENENPNLYFKNFFRIYSVQREFDNSTLKRDIVETLFANLDVLELQEKFIESETSNFIADFLTTSSFKTGKQHSFLIDDSMKIGEKENVRFQSIIEISAKELIDKLSPEEKKQFENKIGKAEKSNEESLIKYLKENDRTKKLFKTHHKYIAIVHIDGDNFSKINKNLDDVFFKMFSDCLAKYSLRIYEEIKDYGGLPVYIGGDDALFFAPVRNGDKNIFTLIDKIDKIFVEEFNEIIQHELAKKENGIIPSLSVGISLSYYKFPLQEALEISQKQLDGVAKKFHGKNAVAFNVLKHSGQEFHACFNKYKPKLKDNKIKRDDSFTTYKIFKKLITLYIEKDSFLSSLSNKILLNKEILKEIGKDKKRVSNFINQNFDEAVHKKDDSMHLLRIMKVLIPNVYCAYGEKEIINTLYGALRMVKFLNRKDNE